MNTINAEKTADGQFVDPVPEHAEHASPTVASRATQIAFDDNDNRQARRFSSANPVGRGRSSSARRDSISSVRTRTAQANATLPIEFRTVSFGVSASQGIGDDGVSVRRLHGQCISLAK